MVNEDTSIIKRIKKEDRIKLSLNEKIQNRILKATQIESPFKIRTNQRELLEEEIYQNCLNDIIRQNYYPDLNYMNKNKDNYDNIRKSIDDPPGTLALNDLDFQNESDQYIKNQMNINEFQSKYTHKNHLSLLALTNDEIIKRKEEQSWIEEQSIKHNLQRELNIIRMEELSNSNSIINDQINDRKIIFTKSQPRTNLMFPSSLSCNKNLNISSSVVTDINPRNTRYHYTTDFQKDERSIILNDNNDMKKLNINRRNNLDLNDRKTSIILNSPLIKNVIKKSLKEKKFVDKQLRDSYSYEKKSRGTFSRTTR